MDMENFIFDLQRFVFSGGSGSTADDPYLISTVADMELLASNVNNGNSYIGEHFKLTADIDLKDVENFTAIGNMTTSFSGTFNGNGHTISNLTISSTNSSQGLFGIVSDGTVQNVILKDATVSGGWGVGAFVGDNYGTVSNCYVVSAKVSGSGNLGAVVGYNNDGGEEGGSAGTVSNCYYYNTNVSGLGTKAYKLTLPEGVKLAEGSKGFYYDGAAYAAANETITLTSEKALTVGDTKLDSTGENTYTYTMTASDATATAGDFLDSLTKDTTDTGGNTYLITTAAELQDLATYVNGGKNCEGLTFKLANDIDLKDVDNFTAIGKYEGGQDYPFSGVFDGDGHTISNLKISSSPDDQGLFGQITGIVRNVTLKNATVTCQNYVGAIVGYSSGEVSNCYVVSSTVTCQNYVGAVVGYNIGEVSNCYVVSSTVTGSDSVGAVVGLNWEGTVSNCYYYKTTPKSGEGSKEAYTLTLSEGVTATGDTTFTVDDVKYYSGTVTIGGMVAGSTITIDDTTATFTETDNGLKYGDLTLTGLTESTTTAKHWEHSNTTATYKDDYTSASYTLDKNQINYVKASGGETLVTVTGVNSKDGISLSGTTVTVAASALNQGTVTVSDGYTLALANDVTKTETTAAHWEHSGTTATYKNTAISTGYKLDKNQINYVKASGGETLVTVTGVNSKDGISLSGTTVTVAASALNQGTVTVSDGYTLALANDVTTEPAKTAAHWSFSGTTATYKNASTGAYYSLDNNRVTYVKENVGETLITVSGVKSKSGISLSGKTVTVAASALNQGTVTVSDGYTLALANDVATEPAKTAAHWSFSGTTATYKNASTGAYYSLDNNRVTYVKENVGETLITVSGVKSKSGISLSGKTVTVAASALNQGTVTVSDGYTLALANDVTEPVTTAAHWELSGTTATYKNTSTSAGYSIVNNQIVYNKKNDDETAVTVTGVKSKDGISLKGNTVTISKSALNKKTVTVSDGYTLALADDVTEPTTTAAHWELSGTTATYKNTSTSAGYSIVNNQIVYNKKNGGGTAVTVTGVKSKGGISLKGNTVTISKSALNKKTVTVSDGYTLALADDVTEPTTTAAHWELSGTTATYKNTSTSAYYKLSNNKISYKKASGGDTLVTVTGVKSLNGISLSGKKVTISKSALNKKTVTVSNGYTLALADDATKPETYTANEYDAKTMTYTTKGTTAGYTLADNKITYSKGTATRLKFKGVADGAKTANFSLKNKTITISKAAVKTDGTPLKLLTDGYTLKLGKKMAAPETSTTTTSSGGLSVTKGYLLSDNTIEYINENVEIKNTDGKFSMDGTISDGRTFKGTDKADKVTVTGAFNLQIETGAGNDAVTLNGKNSKVYGGAGKDSLTGGDKADTLSGGSGNDILTGGAGNDSLNGGAGNDKLDGGKGNDSLYGGTGNDTLTGGKGYDVFVHSAGKDVVTDYTANDKLSFKVEISEMTLNDSDVILKTSKGSLTVQDGKGKTLNIVDSAGKAYSTVLGGENMTLTNAAASSIKADSGIKQINASKRTVAIKITGNKLNNSIVGGSGNDSLYGGAGADSLTGGAGNDNLYGGNGNDTIIGGKGNDSLWGNAGADTFVYNTGDGNDVIFGFEETDTLQIGCLDYTTSYENNVFTLKFDDGSIQLKNFTASNFHIKVNDSQPVK